MDELMGHSAEDPSGRHQVKLMSVEVSLLFKGFQSLDGTHDGFLSPPDLVRFCKRFNVQLQGRDLSAMLWLMDDNRRGKLTFDDVMKFYLRNRDEFVRSGQAFDHKEEGGEGRDGAQEEEKSKDKVIQTGFGAFGVENENAKGRVFDGGDLACSPQQPPRKRKDPRTHRPHTKTKFLAGPKKPQPGAGTGGVRELTVTSGDLRSQPLLLFRVLFFVALQDVTGEVHLLSTFQTLAQLFGRTAEQQFSCIFLQDSLTLSDLDRLTLSAFVEHLKQQKMAVKRDRGRLGFK
jgi:hypothetical protein